jgi:hypothetical protein
VAATLGRRVVKAMIDVVLDELALGVGYRLLDRVKLLGEFDASEVA